MLPVDHRCEVEGCWVRARYRSHKGYTCALHRPLRCQQQSRARRINGPLRCDGWAIVSVRPANSRRLWHHLCLDHFLEWVRDQAEVLKDMGLI